MKEQYIKRVKKELHLPRRAKNEVLRDLDEIFASAAEHGETEHKVIERLGTPKEFADNAAEQFGVDNSALQKQKKDYFNRCFCWCSCCRHCDLRCRKIRSDTGRRNRAGRRND